MTTPEHERESGLSGELPGELPEALTARLRERREALPFVPGEVDEAVLAAGRAHLAGVRRRRRWRAAGWAAAPLAAAAAVGLVVWVVDPFGATRPATSTPATVAHTAPPGPFETDAVTILDAFALARQRANGDASVTDEQIDAMARRAVVLDADNGGAS